jgi:hypothetical protein
MEMKTDHLKEEENSRLQNGPSENKIFHQKGKLMSRRPLFMFGLQFQTKDLIRSG